MKKGKVIGIRQISVAVMVVVLAAAVWLNMKYSSSVSKTKYMGESTYVSSDQNASTPVNGQIEDDYFASGKAEREKTYKEAEEMIAEVFLKAGVTDKDKSDAALEAVKLAKRKADELAVENLLTAKGYKNPLCIIGEGSVSVAVKGDSVSDSDSLIIKDAVEGQLGEENIKVKIVTVKG